MPVQQYRVAEVCEAIINAFMPEMTWCSVETNELLVDSLDRLLNAPETEIEGMRKLSYEKALDDFIEQLKELKADSIVRAAQLKNGMEWIPSVKE